MDSLPTGLSEGCTDEQSLEKELVNIKNDVNEISPVSHGSTTTLESSSGVIHSNTVSDSVPVEDTLTFKSDNQTVVSTDMSPSGSTEYEIMPAESVPRVPNGTPSMEPKCGQCFDDPLSQTRAQNANPLDINYMTGTGAAMPPWLVVIPRQDWKAKRAKHVTPQSHSCIVMFTYTTDTKPCFTLDKCKRTVRKIQKFDMAGNMPDIPYNFLIGGDGLVYEGRGWHVMPRSKHDYHRLRGHILEIAFIGDYTKERPSDAMLNAALELVDYGRMNFWIHSEFGLIENYETYKFDEGLLS